ncbi:anti-anti-sigma factor [Methanolinea mesophila]|nr:anti-anti-sigma factor [Methanolinea mesophila]
MERETERIKGVLVIRCRGRLDAFGAEKLEETLKSSLQDDDTSVVIDLGEVPYLSSGGIRILLEYRKKLKERGGILALARVGQYPRQVLDMAGFSSVFSLYPTLEEAVASARKTTDRDDLLMELMNPASVRGDLKLSIEPGKPNVAGLRVVGHIDDVLRAKIRKEDIHILSFSESEYSLGLGALGATVDDALPLLGEMITLHGTMVWLPTDGNNTPDFFTPVQDTGNVRLYSGFSVILNGQFHEVITIETDREEGVSIHEVYRELFEFARERKKRDTGVIALVIWGVLAGMQSSGVKKAPLASAGFPDGHTIDEPGFAPEWMDHDTIPRCQGDTLVSFGFGIDQEADLSSFDPRAVLALSPVRYSGERRERLALHNHGVVFRDIPWDPNAHLGNQVKKIVREGKFVDMRHLLESTRLRRMKAGIAYISNISLE